MLYMYLCIVVISMRFVLRNILLNKDT